MSTIVLLGGNPVFTAPADLFFNEALGHVKLSIHLGLEEDETAALAKWHLPKAHYLEAWGDGQAWNGTATIQQPMIQPLFGGRTEAELVALLTGYKDQRAYDVVHNYWSAKLGGEKGWRKALHDGVITETKFVEVSPAANRKYVETVAAAFQSGAPVVEVVFTRSASLYDGRFANNGWLQEAPDPMTKLVWDNAALVSPATARNLGVNTGDLLELARGGLKVTAPVLVQPGQADNSIAVALGYGRTRCGRVGANVGFNGYPLRSSDALGFATSIRVTKTGGRHVIAQTQEHHSMEGRPLVREATLEEYRKEPDFAEKASEVPALFSLWDEHKYDQGNQWGMVIDLNACTGCNACLVACQAENNIPIVGKEQVIRGREMHWIRMDRYFTGSENEPEAVFQPIACQQCESAPCESVCPVAATTHSPEGLNDMAYNRCVGTRYCANNCPYKVRRFNFLDWHKDTEEVARMAYNPDVSVRMRGVMEKCTYCVQRIQEIKIRAKAQGRRAIRDGEIVTACQQTCPAEAIVFGNLNDPGSQVSAMRKQNRDYQILAELNTRPRTSFLAKLRNPNPELANG
ncbi:MAG: 4Fe-4S dicluster domain-containing protein [Acidobacteria bacterium]|nr:4Fe-4S dicluster domain-containing protein [Acidobacteriota bacterium]